MVVFCGLPGPQDKDDSARRIWILDIIFSHMGNERACALLLLLLLLLLL